MIGTVVSWIEIAALGLVDCLRAKRAPGRLEGCRCLEGDDCTHVRTRTDRRYPSIPYQTDYLFASAGLASRLTYCEALASDERFAISDHAPIVADFDSEPPNKRINLTALAGCRLSALR